MDEYYEPIWALLLHARTPYLSWVCSYVHIHDAVVFVCSFDNLLPCLCLARSSLDSQNEMKVDSACYEICSVSTQAKETVNRAMDRWTA